MKFLEIPVLAQLASSLEDSVGGECRIFSKIETYSCKRAGSDKKLYKSLDEQYQAELSRSPDASLLSQSPMGPLSDSSSRHTLISLISTLNASFPDYDFCNIKPEQFRKEISFYMIMNSINAALSAVVRDFNTDLALRLWPSIDAEINLKECDIYSYIPDMESDPYAEDGSVWNFNYFFYNKKLKRLVFFTCNCVSNAVKSSVDDGSWMDENTDDEQFDMDD
eukprot:TRINITY_DN5480_c0_g1_i1.p1 TRINITY_DN5480_c0_g1~~TRINITY_DN5480_c0_g1_i1.p1  ORF type:complete len:222 (+),score=78.17 TRINITY_DN5480_c0_g1_i1:167-832(+)